jgi:hypothetical protein
MSEKPKREDKRQTGKDTGIVTNLGLREDVRDQLAKRDWSRPSVSYDPNHPDNWTTAQCVANRFSGFRIHGFTREVELWVVGVLKVSMPLEQISHNPSLLATMHEEVFQTGGTFIMTDAPVEGMGAKGVIKPKEIK